KKSARSWSTVIHRTSRTGWGSSRSECIELELVDVRASSTVAVVPVFDGRQAHRAHTKTKHQDAPRLTRAPPCGIRRPRCHTVSSSGGPASALCRALDPRPQRCRHGASIVHAVLLRSAFPCARQL